MSNYPDGVTDQDIDDLCPDEAPEWKPPVSMAQRAAPSIMDIMADIKRLSDEILENQIET
jgi:hypothetical protein